MKKILIAAAAIGLALGVSILYLKDRAPELVLIDPDCPDQARFPIAVTYAGSLELGADDVAVLATDGTIQQVTKDHASFDPSFSPDGRRLTFTRGSGYYDDTGGIFETQNIVTSEIDGTDVHEVTAGRHLDAQPVWSPDGEWIAFSRHQVGLMLVPPDGGKPRLLLDQGDNEVGFYAGESEYDWSSDGDQILFTGNDDEDVYVINEDGSGLRRVAAQLGSINRLSWSPDGGTFAFAAGRDVYLMTLEEADPRLFVRGAGSPDFSPDGSHLLYLKEPEFMDAQPRLMTKPVDGGGEKPLGENEATGGNRGRLDWLNCR